MQQFATLEPANAVAAALVAALDVVDFGIVLLDGTMRVRFANSTFVRLWNLPDTIMDSRPTFRQLIDHAVANQRYAVADEDLPAHMQEREAEVRRPEAVSRRIALRDGRCILSRCAASPDGGRILTYTDISNELADALARTAVEARFITETMEDQAAHLATLAEAAEDNAQRAEAARILLEIEIDERRQLESRLRVMATTDGLTGALNRAAAVAGAETAFANASRSGQSLTLMMVDVDHFKRINDRYGHAAGDQALRHLVAVLRAGTRQFDLVGRLGGEEFLVVLPDMASDAAEAVAERLRGRVAETPIRFADRLLTMTISIGVATCHAADQSAEQTIARADAALYRAKSGGRNRVERDLQAA